MSHRLARVLHKLSERSPSVSSGLRAACEKRATKASALFFLSTGRTGTQTLTRMFERSNRAFSVHEAYPEFYPDRLELYLEKSVDINLATRTFLKKRCFYLALSQKLGKTFVESSPFLSFHTPAINQTLPRAKFIFLHRHPGEWIRSGMRRGWYVTHPHDNVRLKPRPGTKEFELWGEWGQFEKVCWKWAATNEECLRCYELLDRERRMMIPSQAVWDNPIVSTQNVFRFANLPPPKDEEIIATLEAKHNRQTDGEFPLFNDWSPEQMSTFFEIAGSTMKKLGYSN